MAKESKEYIVKDPKGLLYRDKFSRLGHLPVGSKFKHDNISRYCYHDGTIEGMIKRNRIEEVKKEKKKKKDDECVVSDNKKQEIEDKK